MAQTAITTDVGEPLDVAGALAPQIALDFDGTVDRVAQTLLLFLGEILDPDVRVDAGLLEDLLSGRKPDPEDVGQRDLDTLLAREIDAGNTCHQPWTCLCLGLLSQITRTLPSRRMMMHFSQMRLTDGRTFIICTY